MKTRIVSGIRPTQKIHIGNYLGALENWTKLQNKYDCYFFIPDLHALTTEKNPGQYSEDLVRTYLAAGLDPKKCTIFIQSHVPECTELAWIFNCLIPVSELERMTQYKDKSEKSPNAGLLTYPSLMAADILLYKAHGVPVGKDQKQHVEITRKFARNFNKAYSKIFPEPKVVLTPFAKLMSFTAPNKKMSKSEPKGCLFMSDTPNEIKQKIKKAVTTPKGVDNLHKLLKAFGGPDKKFKQYLELKQVLSKQIIKKLEPIQKKKKSITNQEVNNTIKKGANKAREIAKQTMQKVKEKLGLI